MQVTRHNTERTCGKNWYYKLRSQHLIEETDQHLARSLARDAAARKALRREPVRVLRRPSVSDRITHQHRLGAVSHSLVRLLIPAELGPIPVLLLLRREGREDGH